MPNPLRLVPCLLLLAGLCAGHEKDDTAVVPVVPKAEHDADAAKAFAGPRENRGISKIEPLAAIDLGSEFPELKGRRFRARVITIDPGGVVAVHEHQQRPGIAYILEGEVVEHRNDGSAPTAKGVGKVAIEHTGVVHWWENVSGRTARALVVDIVPE